MEKKPLLYIVPTPIGNLEDISERAKAVLEAVDIIAAEDTRRTKNLLNALGITKTLISMHSFNEEVQSDHVLEHLFSGSQVALVSDAGTPLISDPGYPLINKVREAGYQIVPLPGPCAAITALSASGLPTHRFAFEGFTPAKEEARCQLLRKLFTEQRTLVFYESTHRLVTCLENMRDVFGLERQVVLAKELTKQHESLISGNFQDILDWLQTESVRQKGEFVIIVSGYEEDKTALSAEVIQVLETLASELPLKQAAKLAAKITGTKKNLLYQYGIDHLK